MQTYMHVIKEVQQETADKMDAILKPGGSPSGYLHRS
jgi:hypothetical protein